MRPAGFLCPTPNSCAIAMLPAILVSLSLSSVAVANEWQRLDTDHSPQLDSGSVFAIQADELMGVFGGYSEALDISGTTAPSANTFYNSIWLFDTASLAWSKAEPASELEPSPRAMSCVGYHEGTSSLYVFGGVSFAADFSHFEYYGDLWRYDFETQSWAELVTDGEVPSPRAASGCALINDEIYLFSGGGPDFAIGSELWRYGIAANSWELLERDDPENNGRPRGRTQMHMAAIPDENAFLMYGGDVIEVTEQPPYLVSKTQQDIWTYDVETGEWTSKASHNSPAIARNHQAFAVTSARYFVVQNGDAQGDVTVASACQEPLKCMIPATPTTDTFRYDLVDETWEQIPTTGSISPTRRSMMCLVDDALYLFGGYGWDGRRGAESLGKEENEHTWVLTLAADGN